MKIVSFNVNGIRATVKKGLFESLEAMNADVYCMQETKANTDQVREALFGLDGFEVYANSANRAGYSGTAIITRIKPIRHFEDINIEIHDGEGRVIGLEFDDFFLVNVYVPNSGNGLARLDYRKTWDDDFRDFLSKLQNQKPVVLCGDLNVAHRPIDLARPKSNYNKTAGYTQTEIDGFDALINTGFVDTFRYLYPVTVKYSWWSFRANARDNNIGWRLDYFLMSKSLLPNLKDSFILNEIEGSDHCPVGVELL
jgi:exodeoxyribonuclease-3